MAGGAGAYCRSQLHPRYSLHTPLTVTVAVAGQAGLAPGSVEVTAADVAAAAATSKGQTMSQMGRGQRRIDVMVWV